MLLQPPARNVDRHRASVSEVFIVKNGRSDASVHGFGTPVMGIGLWGLGPLCEIGISRRSVYQMTTSREQARGEGNCGRVTELAHLRGTA
jgi:hypothetical protein